LKDYETVFVLHPRLDDNQVEEEVQKVKDIITQNGGQIIDVQKWGRKRLAYEIKKVHEGIYTLVHFSGESQVKRETDRRFRINENVLRHLTVVAHPASMRKTREGAAAREGEDEVSPKEPLPEAAAPPEEAPPPGEAPAAVTEETPPAEAKDRESTGETTAP
jgi:small subunit ribosomal protein S6